MDADGDFVITWSSHGQDGSEYGIYAQRYNAAGVAQGEEFQVNSHTANQQRFSTVAMDADGDFVITWTSLDQDGGDYGIYAQRYNATGAREGTEFRVNSHTDDDQRFSAVAMDADGDFVVVWSSLRQDRDVYGVYAQRYDAAGAKQGTEFKVSAETIVARNATVAMDADGDFVVTWSDLSRDGSGYGIYARRFNAAGVKQGGQFQVNTSRTDDQYFSTVAMDADGDFIVTWTSEDQGYDIYAQQFHATGVKAGSEFLVNSYTDGRQESSSVAMDADGDFVVAWSSHLQDGSGVGVFAQRYRINHPPTATNLNQLRQYTQGSERVSLADIRVSDLDAPYGEAIRVTLKLANPAAGRLTTSGLATYDPDTGFWHITSSVSKVNAALARVAFIPAANNRLDTFIRVEITDGWRTGPPKGKIKLDVMPPDIAMKRFTADGFTKATVAYDIDGESPTEAFDIGFYRSADGTIDSDDRRLDRVRINQAADLTPGRHSLNFEIGEELLLPGAGLSESGSDYQLLAVADFKHALEENDNNNVAAFEGAYHEQNGPVVVHGRRNGDDIIIDPKKDSFELNFNGSTFVYRDDVDGFWVRSHAGADKIRFLTPGQADDAATAQEVQVAPLIAWGGEGNDEIFGGEGDDYIDGGPSKNKVRGNGGRNVIVESGEDGNSDSSLSDAYFEQMGEQSTRKSKRRLASSSR
jgi:hypothetical protein